MSDEVYINPANIFLMRDFMNLETSEHGAIEIDVEGGTGWRARKAGTFESLVSGLDVWQMCRWLNDRRTLAAKR